MLLFVCFFAITLKENNEIILIDLKRKTYFYNIKNIISAPKTEQNKN